MTLTISRKTYSHVTGFNSIRNFGLNISGSEKKQWLNSIQFNSCFKTCWVQSKVANNRKSATYKTYNNGQQKTYETNKQTNTRILINSLRRHDNKLISILTNRNVIISLLKKQASLQTECARESDVEITNIRKIYVCCRILSNDNKPCDSTQLKHFSS